MTEKEIRDRISRSLSELTQLFNELEAFEPSDGNFRRYQQARRVGKEYYETIRIDCYVNSNRLLHVKKPGNINDHTAGDS